MTIDSKEVSRYLGYRQAKPDDTVSTVITECGNVLLSCAEPRYVSLRVSLKRQENGLLSIGGMTVNSKSLAKHLTGCDSVFLFAATLGAEVDRLIRKSSVWDISRAVILQACAASLIESYCDESMLALKNQAAAEALFLLPRFSPGYGDFSIIHQQDLLKLLDCPKKIGLTMTNSYMLTPSKSVTAVIGITSREQDCPVEKCAECPAQSCPFRK